jgi:hypothetical protein
MRIPTWRLVLTGGAIVVLAALGLGLVAASSTSPSAPTAPAAAAPSTAPGATSSGAGAVFRERLAGRLGRALASRPIAKHLVHATVTLTDRNGNLVTFQLDHGTIASIGPGAMVIAEAGGGSVSVSTDANTVVFLGAGAGKGTLGNLKAGDQVFVQSRLDGGMALAKRVLRVPAATGG